MWTVIYLAPDKEKAEEIKQHLQEEGFLVMLRSAGTQEVDELSTVEVLVPETEAQEAQDLITTTWIDFRR